MTTALYSHPACLAHETGSGHPERKERLSAILAALAAPGFAALAHREAPAAAREDLLLMHDPDYVAAVFAAIPARGLAALDGDTVVSPGSGEAALHAAGAILAAIAALDRGEIANAFCAVRPPGHHALRDRAMGFCLFNNIAIGAAAARARHGMRRVAVVDFDVHHGNGTQAMFAGEADLFYASTHQSPLYPGTGGAGEAGNGNIVNAPLPAGAGSGEFRAAMEDRILPALDSFRPDLILVSAGFDAHRDDPLAGLALMEADFAWITERLLALADRHCGGRLISILEGGYDLDALAASAAAHVKALLRG